MARSIERSIPGVRRLPARPRRAYWQALLAAWRRSGLSQVAFCRRRGLSPGTFGWWKHTLTREAGEPRVTRGALGPGGTASTFVPVRIVPGPARRAEAPGDPPPAGDGAIEIVLASGGRVRVRGRVEPTWLAAVVRALETARC